MIKKQKQTEDKPKIESMKRTGENQIMKKDD